MAQVAFGDISTGAGTSSNFSVNHSVAAGERLVVGVLLEVVDANKEVSSITWDNELTELTKYDALDPSHGKLRLEVWYSLNPVVNASSEVVISIEGGNAQKMGVICLSVQNGHATTLLNDWAHTNNTGTTAQLDADDGSGLGEFDQALKGVDDLYVCFAGHLQSVDAFTLATGDAEHADFAVEGSFRMWCASSDANGTQVPVLRWTQAQSKEFSFVGFIIEAAAVAAVGRSQPVIKQQAVARASFH